jgi:hypothetical protein
MDQKGFLATSDAILGLIVVMILFGTIINVINVHFPNPSQELGFSQDAQDALGVMASSNWQDSEGSILSKVTQILEKNNNTPEAAAMAGVIAGEFLNLTLGGVKYNFTESKQLNGTTIACNGDMSTAQNIDSATRTYGNYSFQLYIWK